MSADTRPGSPQAFVRSTVEPGRSGGALIVAWQHPDDRTISPVGRLEHGPGLGYRFRYLISAPQVAGFQPFLTFPDWAGDYRSPNLFPLFSQRIMSPRRPDYSQYLRQLHLDADASPWEQMARAEGRRHGDTVQVLPIPTVDEDGTSTSYFLAHGVRHVVGSAFPPLSPGDALELRPDPGNRYNPAARLILDVGGTALGYVPDLLLEHVVALELAGPVDLRVEHVNGPDAPPHLRLLVRLHGAVPTGYVPMSGPPWEPAGPRRESEDGPDQAS